MVMKILYELFIAEEHSIEFEVKNEGKPWRLKTQKGVSIQTSAFLQPYCGPDSFYILSSLYYHFFPLKYVSCVLGSHWFHWSSFMLLEKQSLVKKIAFIMSMLYRILELTAYEVLKVVNETVYARVCSPYCSFMLSCGFSCQMVFSVYFL